MAEELQKDAWDNSRALCEAGAVPRELVLNTGASDSYGPELIISDDTGTSFYHFPSLDRLGVTDTSLSGISLLGVDDSTFTNISGANGQLILESIDDLLTTALSASSSAYLSDISVNSLTTTQQTFQVKNATSFVIADYVGNNLIDISQPAIVLECENGYITLTAFSSVDINGISGPITLDSSESNFDIILKAGTAYIDVQSKLKMNGNAIYISGDEDTDGSWKRIVSGADLLMQKRVSGSWVTKQTISGA